MKRIILVFLFFTVSRFMSYSQFAKGDILLDFTGSYVESINSSGGNITSSSLKSKTLDLNLSLGYCFSNSFALGFGLEYGHIDDLSQTRFLFYQRFALL